MADRLADTCCPRCDSVLVDVIRVDLPEEPKPRPDSTVTIHTSCARCSYQGVLITTLLAHEESDDVAGEWAEELDADDDEDDEADEADDDEAELLREYAHQQLQAWCAGELDEDETDFVAVVDGDVIFLDYDCTGAAIVRCHGHCDPISVYEAACCDGADLDDLTVERIEDGPEAGAWLVW